MSTKPISSGAALELRMGNLATAIAVLLFSGWLWYAGAQYTLLGIQGFYDLAPWGTWKWVVPVLCSLAEVYWRPRSERSAVKTIFFLLVAVADLLTTTFGIATWLPGRSLAIGFDKPLRFDPATELFWPSLVAISGVLTFLPEQLGRVAVMEILRHWKQR